MNKIIILLLLVAAVAHGQPAAYTAANLHSHNDYEKPFPFWEAYNQGYGSIEADIFLYGGNLVIAHDTLQRARGRTLDSLYLQPLQQCIIKNKGYPYPGHDRMLQLLIDIKTDSTATVNKLVEKLKAYPLITGCAAVKIVITGNRPATAAFTGYPGYIYFDGELHINYPAGAVSKIEMLSDNFKRYSLWNGNDTIPLKDKNVLASLIAKAHALHKKVRFWNAPDNINSWKIFMALGVDYINTDHITAAAVFLQQQAH
jgi:alkaline phosphatase